MSPKHFADYSFHLEDYSHLTHKQPFAKARTLRKKAQSLALERAEHKRYFPDKEGRIMNTGDTFGIFSIQKLNMDKFKLGKELLQNIKKPSFNIKKMLEKPLHKAKERRQSVSTSRSHKQNLQIRKVSFDKYDLKSFWNRYLQSEMLTPNIKDEFQAFNKSMGLVVNRSQQNRSQAVTRKDHLLHYSKQIEQCVDDQRLLSNETKKDAYYFNNFTSSRYRKRKAKFVHSPQHAKRLGLEESADRNQVVPWEQSHQTQEDNFVAP